MTDIIVLTGMLAVFMITGVSVMMLLLWLLDEKFCWLCDIGNTIYMILSTCIIIITCGIACIAYMLLINTFTAVPPGSFYLL